MCVRDIDFVCSYDFSNAFWNCSDSVVILELFSDSVVILELF